MFNKVVLVGNLTRDIELRYAANGNGIGNTAIAVTRKFNVNGEKREETCFVDITFFGKMAEVANQYLRKGSKLLVEGRLKFDQWNDATTGQPRSKHSVVVENMEMLGSPQNQQNGGYQQQGYAPQQSGYAPQQNYAVPQQQGYASQPRPATAAPAQRPAPRPVAATQQQQGYATPAPQQQGYAQPKPAAAPQQAAAPQAQYAPQDQGAYDDGGVYVEQDETIPF